jgi:peroxiredoxin
MARLRRDHDKFTARDAEIIAVGPESRQQFAVWWRANDMPFTGIADPEHRLAKVYSQQMKILRGGRMPALFVIDKGRRIRFSHFANSPSDIPANEEVLALLEKLNETPVEATQTG